MAFTFMSIEEFVATRRALQEASDVATLSAMAQSLAERHNNPDAKRLLMEIAAKRERLAGQRQPQRPSPSSTSGQRPAVEL